MVRDASREGNEQQHDGLEIHYLSAEIGQWYEKHKSRISSTSHRLYIRPVSTFPRVLCLLCK